MGEYVCRYVFSQCLLIDVIQPYCCLRLTSRWHCILKHFIELAEVHDHREFVWLQHRGHLLASHAGRDAKFSLRHVETQLVVLLLISLIQRVKVSESGGHGVKRVY